MITFFRRIFNSKIGLVLSFLFIALIGVAFVGGDMSNITSNSGGSTLSGDTVAEVGKHDIDATELNQRINNNLDVQRRQQPGLDMASFLANGGLESTLEQIINVSALNQFGEKNGLSISKRLVDGELASIPAFFGPTGKFDRNVFLQAIGQQRLTETQIREDIATDLLTRQLLLPAAGAGRMPAAMARPYAALSLESRNGMVGFIPAAAMPKGAAPTPAELNTYYTRNIARYTVPERRVIRYALFGRDMLQSRAVPNDAEIAAFYKQNATRYAASERRVLTQVILQDQNAARAFEAKVKGGTSFAAAAKQAKREPVTLAPQDRAAFGSLASPEAATAAFALPKGGVTAPQRSGLGWHVVRVDDIQVIAARPLATVRDEIVKEAGEQKLASLLADLDAKIQEGIADGQTFDEIVKANGLQVVTTPAITATGMNPDDPAVQSDPNFARFLAPMFESQPGDDPAVETIQPGAQYALAKLDSITPPTPRPLARIAAQVTADLQRERGMQLARTAADGIIAKAAKGVPLAQAMREAGANIPAPEALGGRRRELSQGGQRVAPPLALMFSMKEKTAKRLEAPNNEGWFVVWLDKITPGDIRTEPALIAQMQSDFSQMVGDELAGQFTGAIKAELGVKRNPAAEAKAKRQLTGAGGQ